MVALLFVVSLFFFREFFTKTGWGITILVLFLVAYFVFTLFWWRCPNCQAYLGKLTPFAKHCPYCGGELE